nr:immunoglobulin heavy chain junction region [Macaca mulatta]MOW81411.1 immunoglobulin heavy chain junction region [Macaca mulatta]MOW82929.1 immunoglobulin heavy chain junction region [Macaca mulatta]
CVRRYYEDDYGHDYYALDSW